MENAVFRKCFPTTARRDVAREIRLQRIAASVGVAPQVLKTDGKTFIEMDDLGACSIAELYGEDINDVPNNVREDIYKILWVLWDTYRIHYKDVTPYNFMEKNGHVWIIDFGHAMIRNKLCPYLAETFEEGYIKSWNPDFR
jgi:tRNA A-37 threonylcarbamoyl transferase component Bud32